MNTPTINRLLARIDQTRQQLGGKLGALILGFALAVPGIAAPEITQHLRTQLVLDGEAATFTVGTNLNTGVTYEWVHNGDVLAGETSSTLTLGAVDRDAAGWYQVRATDGTGTSTSVAHLHVAPQRGAAVSWGDHYFVSSGLEVVPEARMVRMVDAGTDFSLAIIGDGQVIAWGKDTGGQTNVPAGLSEVVAISAGNYYGLALRADGTVVGWGGENSSSDMEAVPAGLTDVVAIETAANQSLVLKADGTVVEWGAEFEPAPSTAVDVVKISAGYVNNYAVLADGTALTWGRNNYGETDLPIDLGPVRDFSGGHKHSVAVTPDGNVRTWGYGTDNFLAVPENLPPILWAQGGYQSTLAVTADYSLVGWGWDEVNYRIAEQTHRNTWGVGVGEDHAIALVQTVSPQIVLPPREVSAPAGEDVGFDVYAEGLGPFVYQWFHNGVPVREDPDYAGQQTPWLDLDDIEAADAGDYHVEITNAVGTTVSVAMSLTVAPRPVITDSPLSQLVTVGEEATFSITATGPEPLTYRWTRDGLPLAGATAATHTLGAVTRADAGLYAIEVTDADGGRDTRYFELQVTELSFERTGATGVGQATALETVPDVRQLTDLVSIRSGIGSGHALVALNTAGQLEFVRWPNSTAPGAPAGLGTVATYASGASHMFALDRSGQLWIWNAEGVLPSSRRHRGITKLVTGSRHVLGVRDDGRILQLIGEADWLPEYVPDGRVYVFNERALGVVDAAGAVSQFAEWDGYPEVPATLGPVATLAGGSRYFVAGLVDGSVATFGEAISTEVPMPTDLTDVVEVFASSQTSYALRATGTLVGWGEDYRGGLSDLPTDLALLDFFPSFALVNVTPPVFTGSTSPNAAIEADGTLDLAVEVTGAAPITYQWFKDGIELPGETAAQLSIAGVQASDAGSYTVRISNPLGEITSTAFPVMIDGGQVAPRLRRARASQSVMGDAAMTLYEDVTGGTPLTHRWFNGISGDESAPISEAGDALVEVAGNTSGLVWMKSENAWGTRLGESSLLMRWEREEMGVGEGTAFKMSYVNGRIIAVPSSTSHPALISDPDGGWIEFESRFLSSFYPVCYAFGRYFVSVRYPRNEGEYLMSTDGVNWAGVDLPDLATRFTYMASNGQCVVAMASDNTIHRSTDGENWTHVANVGPVYAGTLLTRPDGSFIYTGKQGSVMLSPDGITWTTHEVTGKPDLSQMATDGNQFVVIQGNVVRVSTDGITWTEHDIPGLAAHNSSSAIGYGAGTWVALQGPDVLLSTDGETWTINEDFHPNYSLYRPTVPGVTYSGGRFILSLQEGTLLRSYPLRRAIHVTIEDKSVGIIAGDTTELTVETLGVVTAYQWYKGQSGDTSQPITGATTATWETAALSETTRYWVRVFGAGEQVDSGTYEVVVATPPTIVSSPASREGTHRQEVELSFEVASAAPLTYQWYVGQSGDTSAPIAGATAADYVVPPDPLTRPYWVRAANVAGTVDSATATVTRWQVYNGFRQAWDMVLFEGRWYAADGSVMVSDDGVVWEVVIPRGTTGFSIERLAIGDGVLLGAGDGGIWQSPDGQDWTQLTSLGSSGVPGYVGHLTFGAGVWVSTFPGLAWNDDLSDPEWHHIAGEAPGYLRDIVFAQERFVAVGQAAGQDYQRGTVFSSFDGKSWTERSPTIAREETRLVAVAHGSAGFVAVGHGGTIIKSTDALSWRDVSPTAAAGVEFNAVVWGADRYLAGVADSNTVWWSTEGESWQEVTGPAKFSGDVVFYVDGRFRAEGSSGWAYESSDGVNWTLVSAWPQMGGGRGGEPVNGLAAGNGMFMLLEPNAQYGQDDTPAFVSEDGLSWRQVSSPGRVEESSLVFYQGWFITSVQAGDEHVVRISADGESWRTVLALEDYGPIYRFVPRADELIAVSRNRFLYHTNDGENWTESRYMTEYLPEHLADDGVRAVTSWGERVLVSTDLAHWVPVEVSPDVGRVAGAAYGAGHFVVGGRWFDDFYASTDLSTWTQTEHGLVLSPEKLIFTDGRFLGLERYTPLSSPDGVNWYRDPDFSTGLEAVGAWGSFPEDKAARLGRTTLIVGGTHLALSRRDPTVGGIVTVAGARTITAGEPLRLSVEAVGENLSYQWYAGTAGDSSQPVIGQTGASLELAASVVSSGDRFWVQVSSGNRTWASETLTVDVISPPQITSHPQNQEVPLTGTVTLRVTATGQGNLHYQWWRIIEQTERWVDPRIADSDSPELVLDATTQGIEGEYFVVVFDEYGSTASQIATLGLPSAPVVLVEPEDVSAATGESVGLTVQVQGDSLTYQWRRNGIDLSGETGPQLSLTPIAADDAGVYDVVVQNRGGRVVSQPARLTITDAPAATPSLVAASGLVSDLLNTSMHIPFRVDGTSPKRLLLRVLGPAVPASGGSTEDWVSDPSFTLHDGAGTTVGENDDWHEQPDGGVAVQAAAATVGALPLGEGSADAALVVELAPGYYTMQIGSGEPGRMLGEVWDLAPDDVHSRLASVGLFSRYRGYDVDPVLSFQFAPLSGGKELVTRYLGPGLGVDRALTYPRLRLMTDNEIIGETTHWEVEQWPEWLLADLRSASLAPTGLDAMRIDRLEPGVYQAEGGVSRPDSGSSMLEVIDPSATDAPDTVAILVQPRDWSAPADFEVSFSALTAGPAERLHQWSHNGEAILGADSSILTLSAVQPEHEGSYQLTVTHGDSTVTTQSVELEVWGGGPVRASHDAVDRTVDLGQTLEVTVDLVWDRAAPMLGYRADLPAGWSYVSDTATTAQTRPEVGATGELHWSFGSPSSSGSLQFSYVIRLADEAERYHPIMGVVLFTNEADEVVESEAIPYVLGITALPRYHDADTNRDRRLGLGELLRVIELYNTRAGTTRTGRYRSASATVDGFEPDPAETPDGIARHHAADTNRDGQFSLSELLRVIELYNTRQGTTRTGAYRTYRYGIDGFEPDI